MPNPNFKAELLAKLKKPKLVPVDFGGVPCFVRKWTEKELIEWSIYCQSAVEGEAVTDKYLRCKAIAWSLADAEGNLIFDRDSFAEIAELDPADIGPVFDQIIALQQGNGGDSKKD